MRRLWQQTGSQKPQLGVTHPNQGKGFLEALELSGSRRQLPDDVIAMRLRDQPRDTGRRAQRMSRHRRVLNDWFSTGRPSTRDPLCPSAPLRDTSP